MKKYISAILLFGFLIFILASCGGDLKNPPNGTYKSEGILSSQTWTFKSEDEIKITNESGIVVYEGTYIIDGNKFITTAAEYTITEIKSKSFYINGTKFSKQ